MNANAQWWINALESNEFVQGEGGVLHTVDDEFCCLGVACWGAALEGEVDVVLGGDHYYYDDSADLLPDAAVKWLGLREEALSFGGDVRLPNGDALTTLNDGKRLTFREIAALLRKHGDWIFEDEA